MYLNQLGEVVGKTFRLEESLTYLIWVRERSWPCNNIGLMVVEERLGIWPALLALVCALLALHLRRADRTHASLSIRTFHGWKSPSKTSIHGKLPLIYC